MTDSGQFSHQFLIQETTGLRHHTIPITIGVPLPRGQFHYCPHIRVLRDDETEWPCEKEPISLWNDNSIKWVLLRGYVNLDPDQEIRFRLCRREPEQVSQICEITPRIKELDNYLKIETKNFVFYVNRQEFTFLDRIETLDGERVASNGYCLFDIPQRANTKFSIQSLNYHSRKISGRISSVFLEYSGVFSAQSIELAQFSVSMEFDIDADRVRCVFTIHNPQAARHQGGVWDLGDPNSLFFNSLKLGLSLESPAKSHWKPELKKSFKTFENINLAIVQHASGGANWNSPNHVDASNRIPMARKGYTLIQDGMSCLEGDRATPAIRVDLPTTAFNLTIEKFWQNFPKSIGLHDGQLQIGLFPDLSGQTHELQPGEKKTHRFALDLGQTEDSLNFIHQGPEIKINPEWVTYCGVLPFLGRSTDSEIQHIISDGLNPESGFFAKREVIDEYGWRNFGDLYADHETEGWDHSQGLFISHYNNQYDPVFGFLKQYLLSGDQRWFDLADDLAKHVVDIDIYHTHFDKDEYNNGLFWHTDHYQEAKTSSHRSYSKLQKKNVYIDHAGGGGPGGQHCYTNGLLLHYYLTGHPASKDAVLKLTDWVTQVYEGSGRLMNLVIELKNRNRIDLKNITTGKYPLDRGTGNYIQALLDEYDLSRERKTLARVEHIIKNTVHPDDDLEKRDLMNVEMRWYYTAFLQALTRYLSVKEEMKELDEQFDYARAAFLAYADWMVANEQPYLNNPDILEFPNNTWTAQDLRKVNLLMLAEYYSTGTHPEYRHRAEEILTDIVRRLKTDPNRNYTRILALLMQNYGVFEYVASLPNRPDFATAKTNHPPLEPESFKFAITNVLVAFAKALHNFSLKAEIDWLARRSARVARFLGRPS